MSGTVAEAVCCGLPFLLLAKTCALASPVSALCCCLAAPRQQAADGSCLSCLPALHRFKGAFKGSLFQSNSSSNTVPSPPCSASKPGATLARSSKSTRSCDLDGEAGSCEVPSSRKEATPPLAVPPIVTVATKLPKADAAAQDSWGASPHASKVSSPQVPVPCSPPAAHAAQAVQSASPFAAVQPHTLPGTQPSSEWQSQHPQGTAKTHLMSQKSMECAAAAEVEARLVSVVWSDQAQLVVLLLSRCACMRAPLRMLPAGPNGEKGCF